MADALGITKERYAKWENRSPMPAYFIVRFTLILQLDPVFVLSGRGKPRLIVPKRLRPAITPSRS